MRRFLLIIFLMLTTAPTSSRAAEPAPQGWRFLPVRDETAARSSVHADADGGYGLMIEGNGQLISDGRWVNVLPLHQAQYVTLTARYRAANVEMPARNVTVALVWLDENGKELANADFASTTSPPDAQGWRPVSATFKIPPKAKQAQIELRLRWSPNG